MLPTTTVLALAGPAARATGPTAGLPVVAGAADGPLGNLGAGATEPGGLMFCYAPTEDLWGGSTFAAELIGKCHPDSEVLALAAQAPPDSDGRPASPSCSVSTALAAASEPEVQLGVVALDRRAWVVVHR